MKVRRWKVRDRALETTSYFGNNSGYTITASVKLSNIINQYEDSTSGDVARVVRKIGTCCSALESEWLKIISAFVPEWTSLCCVQAIEWWGERWSWEDKSSVVGSFRSKLLCSVCAASEKSVAGGRNSRRLFGWFFFEGWVPWWGKAPPSSCRNALSWQAYHQKYQSSWSQWLLWSHLGWMSR